MNRCYTCMQEVESETGVCPYCKAPLEVSDFPKHHIAPGTLLGDGRYMVGNALGEGGFGITYVGLDRQLQMKVAIKEYYPTGLVTRVEGNTVENITSQEAMVSFGEGRNKFLNEARTLAGFFSEQGIVSVLNFFESNNTAYIVMEYLEGETLKSYLKRKGRLEPKEAVSLLRPIIDSLAVIHKANLIHRDISPDNIMIIKNGIKLLDFGAARSYGDDNKSKSVMLKEGYAPEEQYRKKGEQGPWTDVYALCGTLYKAITGRAPDDAMERMYEDSLQAPSQIGIEISPEIETAIMKGLAVRKEDRLQSMDELLDVLEGRMEVSIAYNPNTKNVESINADRDNATVAMFGNGKESVEDDDDKTKNIMMGDKSPEPEEPKEPVAPVVHHIDTEDKPSDEESRESRKGLFRKKEKKEKPEKEKKVKEKKEKPAKEKTSNNKILVPRILSIILALLGLFYLLMAIARGYNAFGVILYFVTLITGIVMIIKPRFKIAIVGLLIWILLIFFIYSRGNLPFSYKVMDLIEEIYYWGPILVVLSAISICLKTAEGKDKSGE